MAPDSAPPAPRWQRRKEARPDEILDAALDLFLERGFSTTRIDQIAARAGVGKGTVYLYFPSKEEMFKALLLRTIGENMPPIAARIDAHSGPVAVILKDVLAAFAQLTRRERVAGLPKLIIAEAGNFPELARFYKEQLIDRAMGLFAGLVERGVRSGEFRPVNPLTAAQLIIAPLLFTLIWRSTFERFATAPLDADALVAAHAETLVNGLKARP